VKKTSIRWVIKLGGSLSHTASLGPWLAAIAMHPCIIVPGGGPFADAVRDTQRRHQFSDRVAHDLAIHAMGLYGRMLMGIEPRLTRVQTLRDLAERSPITTACVWLPNPEEPCLQSLKASWDVTSDSIAARLALELEIPDLLLVKSIEPAQGQKSLATAIQEGMVDSALPDVVRGQALKLWLKGPDPQGLVKGLENPLLSFSQLIA